MRFMVIAKASEASERGELPSTDELGAMGAFNEELVRAGVLLAGEGLHPSSAGARVRFGADNAATVVDGPFTETKELIAGFWILQVSSREEAIEWVKRAPFREGEVEVRRVFEPEEFTTATPEQIEAENRLRATVAEQHGA